MKGSEIGMTDREKVIEQLEADIKHADRFGALFVYIGRKQANDVLALLKEQPEIVRCKDCMRHLECDYWIENGDDWFCADGERR